MTELHERPTSIHDQPGLGPQGPWAFVKDAVSGGFNRSAKLFMLGWLVLALLPSTLWASYLMSFTKVDGGWSAMPAHWGEELNAKDMVELFKNGEIHGPLGFGAGTALLLGLFLVLWFSWKHEAEAAGLRPRLSAWIAGALDTILLAVPILIVYFIVIALLSGLEGLGIPSLSWFAFFVKPWLAIATGATIMTQWWLLRLNRLERKGQGWWSHAKLGFLRLWANPVQWFLLIAGLSLLRFAVHALAIDVAWRLGGATLGHLWLFILMEGLAALIGAWTLGWMLRIVALFWRHDQAVRQTMAELEAASTAMASLNEASEA